MINVLLYYIIPPIFSFAKVTSQGVLSKSKLKNITDVLLYNCLAFFFCGVLLLALFFRKMLPVNVLLLALLDSVFIISYQVFYTLSFKTGPVSLTVVISTMSLIMPIAFSNFYFGEEWKLLTIVGMALFVISFILIPQNKDNGKKVNIKWVFYALLTFLSSGISSTIMKYISSGEYNEYKNSFLAVAFIIAGVLSIFVWLFINRKVRGEVKLDKKFFGLLGIIAVSLAMYNYLQINALSVYKTFIYLPISNVSVIVVVAFGDMIFFKEKLSIKSFIGMLVAIVAVVVLNI